MPLLGRTSASAPSTPPDCVQWRNIISERPTGSLRMCAQCGRCDDLLIVIAVNSLLHCPTISVGVSVCSSGHIINIHCVTNLIRHCAVDSAAIQLTARCAPALSSTRACVFKVSGRLANAQPVRSRFMRRMQTDLWPATYLSLYEVISLMVV